MTTAIQSSVNRNGIFAFCVGLGLAWVNAAPAMLINSDATNQQPKPELFGGKVAEVSGWFTDASENPTTDLETVVLATSQSEMSKLMLLWGWHAGSEIAGAESVVITQAVQKEYEPSSTALTPAGFYHSVSASNFSNRVRKIVGYLLGKRLLMLIGIGLVAAGYYRTSQCFQIVHPLWLSTSRSRVNVGRRQHRGLAAWLRRNRL